MMIYPYPILCRILLPYWRIFQITVISVKMKRVASFKTELIKALQNKTDGTKCSPTHLLFSAMLSRFSYSTKKTTSTKIEDRGLVNASFKNPLFTSYIFTKVEMISAEVIKRLQLSAELCSFGKLQHSIHLIARLLLRNSETNLFVAGI